MSIYSDKLAHVQVVVKCRYFIAQLCTREDGLAYIFGAPFINDVMTYNLLTTLVITFFRVAACYRLCRLDPLLNVRFVGVRPFLELVRGQRVELDRVLRHDLRHAARLRRSGQVWTRGTTGQAFPPRSCLDGIDQVCYPDLMFFTM